LGPPAQEPLGCVLEGDDWANNYPVASPSLYLPFVQGALPERLVCRIGWQKEGEPPANDG
jgi:hypothetical protein